MSKGGWAMKGVVIERLTLTTLSQPQDTITGFITFGLKRTHDTL
jgi:hypothetical protein